MTVRLNNNEHDFLLFISDSVPVAISLLHFGDYIFPLCQLTSIRIECVKYMGVSCSNFTTETDHAWLYEKVWYVMAV